ncbi:MAG: ElyC/SanA/YdcF family protein [Bacteroidota bacterium]
MKKRRLIISKAIKSRFFRKLKRTTALFFLLFLVCYVCINIGVYTKSRDYIYTRADLIPQSYTALVLGASVYSSGRPSTVLADRLDKAIELYNCGKIKRFLLSGDHGKPFYDEVINMKTYLIDRGIPDSVIFTDHAGFDTYNSIVRAKEVFGVDSLIIVTQRFHLKRALFIARQKGLVVTGFVADAHTYPSMPYLMFRESFANIKAFIDVLFHKKPLFGGKKIPIKGDSKLSYD